MSELIPSLADVLRDHQYYETLDCREACHCNQWIEDDDSPHTGHAEHVEAEFWKARTVHDRETLDALPHEAVIRDYPGDVYEQWTNDDTAKFWAPIADTYEGDPIGATRVLWLPGEGEQ